VIELVVVIAIVALLAALAAEDSPCAEYAFCE
jgi:Tfp pilus assembly protein PilE